MTAMKGSDRIFTPAFFANAFVNLMLYVNYYVLMVVMAGYCLAVYGTDAGTAGFAASAFIVGALATRFVGGGTFDRRGDFGVMTAGFAAFALGMLCMGCAHDGTVLLAAACLLGFAVGTLNPCGLTLAVQRAPEERLATANSTFSCLNDATIGLAPVAVGWLIPLVGYNGMYLALVAVVVAAFALYLAFRSKGMLR